MWIHVQVSTFNTGEGQGSERWVSKLVCWDRMQWEKFDIGGNGENVNVQELLYKKGGNKNVREP